MNPDNPVNAANVRRDAAHVPIRLQQDSPTGSRPNNNVDFFPDQYISVDPGGSAGWILYNPIPGPTGGKTSAASA